jgi:hypothetical protein
MPPLLESLITSLSESNQIFYCDQERIMDPFAVRHKVLFSCCFLFISVRIHVGCLPIFLYLFVSREETSKQSLTPSNSLLILWMGSHLLTMILNVSTLCSLYACVDLLTNFLFYAIYGFRILLVILLVVFFIS